MHILTGVSYPKSLVAQEQRGEQVVIFNVRARLVGPEGLP